MKKILVAVTGMLMASVVVAAPAEICGAQTTAGNATTAVSGTTGFTAAASGSTGFVLNSFTPKCSANVYLAIEQNEIAAATAAGSKKGKNLFAGSTGGGGVQSAGQATAGASSGDVTGAVTTALAAAGGST